MLFSRRSATSACTIALVVMAVTPYHRFSSSIGLASGAMTWLVILGASLAAFVHGAALCKGGEMRRPRHLGAIGVFLGVIATVPEWADLAFYARGDSIPIVFAPIWLLHGVSCVSCFVGSLLLSYVIWGTADSPLTQRSTRTDERETRHPQDAIFTETIAVMSCLLFCCRVSWRVVPEPWGDAPCNGRVNWPCAFNSVGLSRIDCGPAVLPPSCLWPWAARRVCLFCARSSSYWSYSGC